MSLQFASLGSGSKGNATLIRSPACCLLIDCGFSASETVKRLDRFECGADQLDAVLLTHEHSDHSTGVLALCRRFAITLYASWGTCAALKDRGADFKGVDVVHISGGREFALADLRIAPVLVPHDSREPLQFVVRYQQSVLGILTDIGSISAHVLEQYAQCDALLLECNHDAEMLRNGPYPPSLKSRVAGNWGHLSNVQAGSLLQQIDLPRLQHLVIAHLSEKNNCLAAVREVVQCAADQSVNIVFAEQQHGFDWLAVGTQLVPQLETSPDNSALVPMI